MAIISKFHRLNIPCKNYVHPWCDSCFEATWDLFPSCAKESLRIYVIAYSVALLMKGKIPSKNEVKRTILAILQSSVFLTLHGIGFSASLCTMRRLIGHFNFWTVAFIPKFLVSLLTILVERQSRRALLSLYVTNVASETLFRMAVYRKLITPLRYGEVLVFATSVSYLLYHYKAIGLPKDPVYSLLRFLVGPYEERGYFKMEECLFPPKNKAILPTDSLLLQFFRMAQNKWRELIYKLKMLSSHPSCPHPYSCLHYVLSDSFKKFSIGYGLYLALKVAVNIKKIYVNPITLKKVLNRKENFHSGLCFGLFTGLFRGLSCLMRRGWGTDAELSALPAGFFAGLAFYFYRDNTIALYFMWKSFQISYNVGVERGLLPDIPYASHIFYALSTAILFHVAILEPHNLRPSYWKFLQSMSGGRLAQMDRHYIDEFGLKTSQSLALAMGGRSHLKIEKLA